MRVLFAPQFDPHTLDVASGLDYNYLEAFKNNDFDVKIVGPFKDPPIWLERNLSRVYQRTGKRYLKDSITTAWLASRATNLAAEEWKPDVLFTHYPSPLTFYHAGFPCVYLTDSTFYGVEKEYPRYGKVALWLEIWQEKRSLGHSERVITYSEWSREILSGFYKVPKNQIIVFPMPSALPEQIIPEEINIKDWKTLSRPIRLLLVGRNYRRKGIDIAIDVVHRLNAAGIQALLTVCGTEGPVDDFVRFVGPFRKTNPEQLEQYVDLYRKAHLLIHPALFEAAGIVPGEAAAFGTPTITNNAGGLGTTVENGVSGIVLPKSSPAEAYVKAISELINDPLRYYRLCQTSRERYERELNWGVVNKRLCDVLRYVVQEHNSMKD